MGLRAPTLPAFSTSSQVLSWDLGTAAGGGQGQKVKGPAMILVYLRQQWAPAARFENKNCDIWGQGT